MKHTHFLFFILFLCVINVNSFAEDAPPKLSENARIRRGIEEYNAKNYKAAEEFFNGADSKNLIVVFYKAKILLDEYNDPSSAEKLLLSSESSVKKSTIPNISDSFYSVLLQCKFQQEKWNDITSVFTKIKNPDSKSIYANSAYYYNKGEFSKVDSGTGLLYASALCKMEKYEEACEEYKKLNVVNTDYVKALFACERFEEAYNISKNTNDLQKEYTNGLCQINLQNFALAKQHFIEYIKSQGNNKDFNKLSFFYKGYCEYNLKEYKDSYASFIRFNYETDENFIKYKKEACEYAAKSALQYDDYSNAALQVESLIKICADAEEKQKNIIFCANIYLNQKNYEKALAVLQPYTTKRNDFAAEALFLSAKIYEQKEDVKSADKIYQKIINDFSKTVFAEEAMYKTGETFYEHEDYASAYTRFNSYIYKYANGKYCDAAFYFAGDCAFKLGQNDRAIMFINTLFERYKDTVFGYGAKKILMNAYFEQEEYRSSLEIAEELLQKYPEQAKSDEIEKKVVQLKMLVNGIDKRIVEKQLEYEKQKENTTVKGRIAGTELVQLYAENSYTQKEAYDLAVLIFEKQTLEEESYYAALNAEFIADYKRKNDENNAAALMYLKAAQFYRAVEKSNNAAVCLYSAADAFIGAGMPSDARETAELLKQLYPESRQAQKVDKIIGD